MQPDNDLWRFSLRVYAAPGVADDCLAVQDRHGIDVNVLLLCAWLASERGVALAPDEIELCRRAATDWQHRVVHPLRTARRAMKGLPEAEEIRARVKGLELEAERIEQASLFEFAARRWPQPGGAEPRAALRANLDGFLRTYGASGADAVPALLRAAAA